jgi:hypothetical protein
MLVKKVRKKLPRIAVEALMDACGMLSKEWNKSATEIFKDFMGLMNKYADYFFSNPWPEKYDYEKATTFNDEDVDFLCEGRSEEFADRYTTVCLKKNMNMEDGFAGYFGIFWTQQAFHGKFVRPRYKPVQEAFLAFPQETEDARIVLNKLKEQFDAGLIHNSLIDFLDPNCPYGYPYERRKLIDEMLDLLHTVEGVPSCGKGQCSWYLNQRYGISSTSGNRAKENTS